MARSCSCPTGNCMDTDLAKRSSPHTLSALMSFVALFFFCVELLAAEVPRFDPALPAGSICRVPIKKLHPTQFAVGYREVDQRASGIARKSHKELASYLSEHLALLVIGPGGEPYLVDGHHLCMAMLKARKGKTVEARVEANWRNLSAPEFWSQMRGSNYVYLYDNRGRGPLDVTQLPKRITGLTDDPYRSLAWEVRDRGGFQRTTISFSEFQWANFFRKRIAIGPNPEDFNKAVEAALRLSHTAEAKGLPGFTPQ